MNSHAYTKLSRRHKKQKTSLKAFSYGKLYLPIPPTNQYKVLEILKKKVKNNHQELLAVNEDRRSQYALIFNP